MYTAASVAYAPDQTTVTVDGTIDVTTVGTPNLLVGPNARTQLAALRLHSQEVSLAITAAISSNGVSHNSSHLTAYLATVQTELAKVERRAHGGIARGRLYRS